MKKFAVFLSSLISLLLVCSPILMSGCASHRYEKDPVSYVHSSSITFKVKEALLRDRQIKSSHISVSTYQDTVTLSGYVFSEEERERAVNITRHVNGVGYVVDQLRIKD